MTPCPRCRAAEHHVPTCPEMFWPDGKPRAAAPNLPLPPFNPDKQDFENPGGLGFHSIEFGRIFGGLTEQMIARHIRETAERRDG